MSIQFNTEHTRQGPRSSNRKNPSEDNRDEMRYLIRALSHDLGANFMMIDYCFARLSSQVAVEGSPALLETTEHLGVCLRQSRQFLNDLIALARTGAVDMQAETVALHELVDEVLLQQRDLLRERSIRVERSLEVAALFCNRQRVHQVVTNLVRNAAKHGCDPEQPLIRITTRPSEASPSFVELRVHDNGPGIPPAYHKAIFDPGFRLPDTKADGSGIGLAIIDKIARYYHGHAYIDPEPGTTVVVLLPALRGPLPPRAKTPEVSRTGQVRQADASHADEPRHVHALNPGPDATAPPPPGRKRPAPTES